jgi:hypothetical protein
MNTIVTDYYPILQMYQALRDQLTEALDDADLAFTPGGANPTLGELCREIGETQQSYIESLRTFRQSFVYGQSDPELAASVSRLAAWYAELDRELRAVVEGLAEEDVQGRLVERGPEFRVPPRIQLDIYHEALLIFYGKAMVYLKAMGKTPPEQWREWIG